MRLKGAVSLLACALVSNNAVAQSAPNIASTSLCGDGYVLAIAPDQVSALSWQSRDPLSSAPENYRALPQIWDDPETLSSVQADIIIFGPGEGRNADNILRARGIERVDLAWGEDFDTVIANIATISEMVSTGESSNRIIENLRSRLDRLEERNSHRSRRPKVLYLSRAGGSAGIGTLVDAAIRAAGGENVLDRRGWVTLEIEYLIGLKPDLIITSFFAEGYESVNAAGLRNKAVTRFLEKHERLEVPGHLWPCAGPSLIDAAELIAAKLDTLP